MTNRQLAAARKVMSRFPDLIIRKDGDTLTPVRGEQAGSSVVVTETMPESEVETLLRASCVALNG